METLASLSPYWQTLLATTFTWLMTGLGASLIFFFKNIERKWFDFLLGTTAGVMISAAFWSLLTPAVEQSALQLGKAWSWFPVATGFILGAAFIYGIDKVLPHIHIHEKAPEGPKTGWNHSILLVLAITLHNLPEGLGLGISYGAASLENAQLEIGSALALTLGIGLQNIPEGLAVALPLKRAGLSSKACFFWGFMSAAVEPIGGIIGVLSVSYVSTLLPYILAFAAGAMIFVVVEEVIPETQKDRFADLATLGFVLGFVVMMVLDLSLG